MIDRLLALVLVLVLVAHTIILIIILAPLFQNRSTRALTADQNVQVLVEDLALLLFPKHHPIHLLLHPLVMEPVLIQVLHPILVPEEHTDKGEEAVIIATATRQSIRIHHVHLNMVRHLLVALILLRGMKIAQALQLIPRLHHIHHMHTTITGIQEQPFIQARHLPDTMKVLELHQRQLTLMLVWALNLVLQKKDTLSYTMIKFLLRADQR
jgi:hypothetical protein